MHDFVMSAAYVGQSMSILFFKDTMLLFFSFVFFKQEKKYVIVSLLMFLHGFDFLLVFRHNDIVLFWPATSFYQIVSRKSVLFRHVLPSFLNEMFSSINLEEIETMYVSYDSLQVNYFMW